MLPIQTSQISRRDLAVPGLDLLLDAGAFADAMRQVAPRAELQSARITYVKYKPGTNCLVGYRFQLADREVTAYAKACGPQSRDKLSYWQHCQPVGGPLGEGVHWLLDGAIAVCVWPNDAKSKTLRLLEDADRRRKLFKRLLSEREELWAGELKPLVYKPERRFVGCLTTPAGPQAVIKIYANAGHEVLQLTEAIRLEGRLRLPVSLGRSERRCAEAFGWVSGRVLSQALTEPQFEVKQMRAVGEALAELHALPPWPLLVYTHADLIRELRADATMLTAVFPQLAARAERCLQAVSDRLEPFEQLSVSHGDFHARQVVLGEQSVTLLDFDRARLAPPAMDLASLAASLRREVVRGGLDPARAEAAMECFLEGYGQSAPRPSRRELELHIAAELLRLSTRFFRYWELDWPERTVQLLAQAETILDHRPSPRETHAAAACTGAC